MNPPHGDLVLSEVSICASLNLAILGVKFDSKLTFENHVRGIASSVSPRIGIFRLVKRVFVNTSVLLRCVHSFQSFSIDLRCGGLLLYVIFSLSSATCIRCISEFLVVVYQSFLSLCHRRHVATLSMLYKVNSNSNHCLFSELPSVSARVRHLWNSLPYIVFDTGKLDVFKGAVNSWLLPWVVFFSFSHRRCLWGCEIYL